MLLEKRIPARRKGNEDCWTRGVGQVCSHKDVFEEGAGTGTGSEGTLVAKRLRPWWRMGTISSGKRTWNGWKAVAVEESSRCVGWVSV